MPRPTHVFFVPGVPTRPRDLEVLFDALPPGATGRVVCPPGYGGTPVEAATFRARADGLRAALDTVDPDGRWIVGYSAGGYDALQVLADGVAVDGVVLLNAAFGPSNDAERDAYRATAEAVRRGDITGGVLADILLSPSARGSTALSATAAAWIDAAPREHIARELESYADQPSLDDVVAAHAERVVLVHSTLDASVPIARARDVAARTGATLVELDGVGHASMIEAPALTCAALRRAWGHDG